MEKSLYFYMESLVSKKEGTMGILRLSDTLNSQVGQELLTKKKQFWIKSAEKALGLRIARAELAPLQRVN